MQPWGNVMPLQPIDYVNAIHNVLNQQISTDRYLRMDIEIDIRVVEKVEFRGLKRRVRFFKKILDVLTF